MSYWSLHETAPKSATIMTKKSVELAKRYYPGVHLITDCQGAETFCDLDWLSISTELETLPKEYKDVWSLGKIKACNIIASKHKPFIHIDYDFFLLKKLPEHFEASNVLFQSKEELVHFKTYSLDSIYSECQNLFIKDIPRLDVSYNCGVIGGNNYNFFKQFTERSLNCVLDPCNRNFWLGCGDYLTKKYQNFSTYSTKALLAEQYFAAATCKEMNITPSLLIDGQYHSDGAENDQFIHLYGKGKTKKAYSTRVEYL